MSDRDTALANHPDGTCLDCGGPLQAVRPGKHQCNCCDNIRHLETALEETAKLAATLKQERDEARKLANNIDLCQGGVAPCDLAVKLMAKLDEANKLIAALHEDQARLILERDRLRQQLATQDESTPQDNPTRHGGRVEKTEQDLQHE